MLYDAFLQGAIQEAEKQEEILGLLLTGSVARGDALPGSDLDLRFILAPGNQRKFQSELLQGILIERGYADVSLAQSRLETNPMEVYAYLDGRILYDPTDILIQLRGLARERFETYRISEQELDGIIYWLKSSRIKIAVALKAEHILKASFVASTSSWQILQGLWAVNNKPMPPNGSVWPHLKDLLKEPPDLETLLKRLFCGEAQQRVQTALELIDWIIENG